MNYKDRCKISINNLLKYDNKNTFLIQIKYNNNKINDKVFYNLLDLIHKKKDKADFNLLVIIRLLYFEGNELDIYKKQIDEVLQSFPFWPGDIDDERYKPMQHLCFWSENHIFMYLSAAVLYYERAQQNNLPCLVTEKEVKLLLCYLHAHVSFEGVYEVLSHVYLPYTLSALLNLFDFSINSEIRGLASIMINNIIEQLLLCTNIDGISTFTASTRQFNKMQTRNWGHNVNQLIYFLIGKSTYEVKPTAITDILLTSNWTPIETSYQSFNLCGFYRKLQNHQTEHIHKIYHDHCRQLNLFVIKYSDMLDTIELTPFLW